MTFASRPFRWTWWAWIACFVLDDFFYYVFHRSAHRVRWFWAAHVNHHSSQHYNLSTALRQTWTGFFAFTFLFRLPLVFIGFHPAMILFVGAHQPDLPILDSHRGHLQISALVRIHHEHAEPSPRPPRHQSALPGSQLCRGVHHLGPDVRHLHRRGRRRENPLWHRQATRHIQPAVVGIPRMGRHRSRHLVRTVET